MSTLIVSDVFEAYYDGRKSAFAGDRVKAPEAARREEKPRPEAANKDGRLSRAA